MEYVSSNITPIPMHEILNSFFLSFLAPFHFLSFWILIWHFVPSTAHTSPATSPWGETSEPQVTTLVSQQTGAQVGCEMRKGVREDPFSTLSYRSPQHPSKERMTLTVSHEETVAPVGRAKGLKQAPTACKGLQTRPTAPEPWSYAAHSGLSTPKEGFKRPCIWRSDCFLPPHCQHPNPHHSLHSHRSPGELTPTSNPAATRTLVKRTGLWTGLST